MNRIKTYGVDGSGDIKQLLTDSDGKLLITEGNSDDLKTALEAINTALQSSGITQTQLDNIKTALELIDDTIGTIDSAFSGKVLVIGGKAESSVPTEVADGDALALQVDTFGRIVLKGYNSSSGALQVEEISPINENTLENSWTTLTEVGETSALNVLNYKYHTVQITVAAIDSTVDINVKGSLDGDDYFDLESTDVQYSANGTYSLDYCKKLKYIKFAMTAESGTNVTVTASYLGGN